MSATVMTADVADQKGGGRVKKAKGRELPEELQDSEEAVAVWKAARAASADQPEVTLYGWRVKWVPRQTRDGRKCGDMYVFPPRDAIAERSRTGATIRSLVTLREVLLLRKATEEGKDGIGVLSVGDVVEVRLPCVAEVPEAATADAVTDGASDQLYEWRRAEVRQVGTSGEGCDGGGWFQVVLHDATGAIIEEHTQWCQLANQDHEWRRLSRVLRHSVTGIAGDAAGSGKRKRRCGQCDGCLAADCGQCGACLDKPKFGGAGVKKQACVRRQCARPSWPTADGSATYDPWLSHGARKEIKESRVGAGFQAELPKLTLPSIERPPAPPPLCRCALPATWARWRWWCPRDESVQGPPGCDLELHPPPHARTPTCDCGERADWDARTEAWRCQQLLSRGGCSFGGHGDGGWSASPRPVSPQPVKRANLEKEHAMGVAARLTSSAYAASDAEVFGPPVESDEDELGSQDAACGTCGSDEHPHLMLLCDGKGCSSAFHTFCLSPPLDRVPVDKWYCPTCSAQPGAPEGSPSSALPNILQLGAASDCGPVKAPLPALVGAPSLPREPPLSSAFPASAPVPSPVPPPSVVPVAPAATDAAPHVSVTPAAPLAVPIPAVDLPAKPIAVPQPTHSSTTSGDVVQPEKVVLGTYTVDRILTARGHGVGRRYLVKWEGYAPRSSPAQPSPAQRHGRGLPI